MWIVLVFFIVLTVICYLRWRPSAIKRWRKALALDTHEPVYRQLYSGVDGFALSREARRQHDAIDYVYGEIDFTSFIALLSLANPGENTVFYDLGSGTGKAVLACAIVFKVKKSCGIELFTLLHDTACKQQETLSLIPDYKIMASKVKFINDDFLHADYRDATLIFINATGYFGQTWLEISQRLEQYVNCVTVITTSKALKSNAFTVIKITTVQMSWGMVRAFIQQRKNVS